MYEGMSAAVYVVEYCEPAAVIHVGKKGGSILIRCDNVPHFSDLFTMPFFFSHNLFVLLLYVRGFMSSDHGGTTVYW